MWKMEIKFLLIFCTICIIVQCISAYKTYQINDLCPASALTNYFHKFMNNKPEVLLGVNHESAAIIQQSWNSSSFKRITECNFNVDATHNFTKQKRGLYILIRRLNLRKSANGEKCIDSIQFKFGSVKTPKFCGVLSSATDEAHKIFFGEKGGMMKIFISIDKFVPLKHLEDTLDIELVATAHEACDPYATGSQIKCIDSDPDSCIAHLFQNDNIVNCPPPFCTDESSICPVPPIKTIDDPKTTPSSSGTDLFISALTSLIFTLVGVGSCLWLCLHVKDCCANRGGLRNSNSGQINGSNAQRSDPLRSAAPDDDSLPAFSPTLEMPTTGTFTTRPSAPPIDHKDIDKPPAYDALFPTQAEHRS